MQDMAESVSSDAMTKCMAMVEERAKHALRIFADLLKTPAGRTAAASFTSHARRDASSSMRATASRGGLAALTAGTGSGMESKASEPSPQDIARMLMDASRVCWCLVLRLAVDD